MPNEPLTIATPIARYEDPLVMTEAEMNDPSETYAMPATTGQERFWSVDGLQPGNPALNMPLMWQCNGDLDAEAMQWAFQQCVERHESLRTTFKMLDGKLTQLVHSSMPFTLPMDDLSHLHGDEKRLETDRITREHAAIRFNLQSDPLLAVRLLRLAPQSHVLLVTMHHIICDGISNGILWRDALAYYGQAVGAGASALPHMPIQFADYAVWHDMWRTSPEYLRSLDFWRQSLGTGFRTLRVAHDPDAPEALPAHLKGSTGAIETLLVPQDVVTRARRLCQQAEVTPNVLFFSAFLAWLSRLTGERDLTVGYPVGNRNEDTENLIGLFMNIQPIRMMLEESTTFRDLLDRVQRWTVEAGEHQHFPFEDLVHDTTLGEGEQALQIPIFFLFQPSFMLSQRISTPQHSLQIVPLRSESPGAVFEWMMAVIDRPEEGPRLQLEYNPQLYKASTIQRHLRTLVSLIDGAVSNPDQAIKRLPLLSPAQAQSIMERHSGPAIDFGPFEAVSMAIQKTAAAHPHRAAIEFAGESLTYAQLLQRAEAIATRLREAGAQPGDRIAICMGRSADMPASVLAVLLAGCAYVPLDARHPRERLQDSIADAEARVVLTDGSLQLTTSATMLCVQDIRGNAGRAFEPYRAAADDLAYVIYTSGSTGKPKGVAITHGTLRNLLLSMKQAPGLTADDVLVAITTISFDIATLELLLPLLVGAKIAIASDTEARTPSLLLPLLQKVKATVLQATPGAWRALVEEGWNGTPTLKVMCGGEALSRDLAHKLLERSSSVWNMYGPTETTIWSSATQVKRGDSAPRVDSVIANTQMYVLDGNGELLPPGMEGELCIGGDGLARGYWNRPELTAEKFVQNPFGPGRIYRTGDSACLQDDGSLRLLGRIDFQVKVRGYRIELGEIEYALVQHDAVREAVVVQHVSKDDERAGVARMIAYVHTPEHTGEEAANRLVRELEEMIAKVLPEYMVPNAIVALPELPRLLNGKVNRKELPDVFQQADDRGVRASATEEEEFQLPRDFLERQLTMVWQTTLGIPRISTRASFFSLGVGSLAAMRLVTKMNRIFAMDLGLATLVSSPSIEAIAELIRNRHDAGTKSALVKVRPEGDGLPLFILHGVGGNIINFFGLSRRIAPGRPIYAIQSQALLSGQAALLRMEDMAAFYIREIKTVQPQGPYHLFGYSFGGTVAAEMQRQLREAGEQVALLAMLDARTNAFQEEFRGSMTAQTKVDRRVKQLMGNTRSLSWKDRTTYIAGKLATRGVRVLSRIISSAGFRKMPSRLKVAYDVNYVAMKRYRPHVYKGKLVLFRATEQEYASGPRDLGWANLFPEGVEIREISGDHERIFLEPAVDELAKAISATLEKDVA